MRINKPASIGMISMLLLALLFVPSPAHAESPPNLSLPYMTHECYNSGAFFTTDLTASNLATVVAWQVNVTFTPGSIAAVDYTLGDIFAGAQIDGTGFAVNNTINEMGTFFLGFTFMNGAFISTTTPIILVTITWETLIPHPSTPLHIVSSSEDPGFGTILLDPSFNSITYTTTNGFYECIPDFTVNSAAVWIHQGSGSGSSLVTILANPTFSGNVTVSLNGPPSGTNYTLLPSTVSLTPNGLASSTLTISPTSSLSLGTYSMTLIATSGNTTHSAPVTLGVLTSGVIYQQTLNFPGLNYPYNSTAMIRLNLAVLTGPTIILNGTMVRTVVNSTMPTTVFYNDTNSVNYAYSLSTPSLALRVEMPSQPAWLLYLCSLDLTHTNGNASCSLFPNRDPDINHDAVVDVSDLSLVSGSFGCSQSCNPSKDLNGDGHIDIVDLTIVSGNFGQTYIPGGDFAIVSIYSALSIPLGSSATSTIRLTGVNGLSGRASLRVSYPSVLGLSATLTQTSPTIPISGFVSSTLRVYTTSLTPRATYVVTVTGTYGALSHSVTITVTVQ